MAFSSLYQLIEPWVIPFLTSVIILKIRSLLVEMIFNISTQSLTGIWATLLHARKGRIIFGVKMVMSSFGLFPFYWVLSHTWFFNILVTLWTIGFAVLATEISHIALRYAKDTVKVFQDADDIDLAHLLEKIALAFIVIASTVILLYFYSGSTLQLSSLISFLGFTTAAVSFAARDYIGNFMGSVSIIISNPFSKGEEIEAEGVTGKVESFGFQQTILRDKKQSLVYIPNSSLMIKGAVFNKSRATASTLFVEFFVKINVNEDALKKALEAMLTILKEHPAMPKNNKPEIIIAGIKYGLFHITLFSLIRKDAHFENTRQEILLTLKSTFMKEGISFASENQ